MVAAGAELDVSTKRPLSGSVVDSVGDVGTHLVTGESIVD